MFFRVDKLNVFIGHGILFKSNWCLGANIDPRKMILIAQRKPEPKKTGENLPPLLNGPDPIFPCRPVAPALAENRFRGMSLFPIGFTIRKSGRWNR
jgi:hypothetical protein